MCFWVFMLSDRDEHGACSGPGGLCTTGPSRLSSAKFALTPGRSCTPLKLTGHLLSAVPRDRPFSMFIINHGVYISLPHNTNHTSVFFKFHVHTLYLTHAVIHHKIVETGVDYEYILSLGYRWLSRRSLTRGLVNMSNTNLEQAACRDEWKRVFDSSSVKKQCHAHTI